ncbi:MAG: hypothetical protein C0179_03460 [Fervidicoccus sp.]|nr:MAG: hypothetical protein C0179_03460 [Fervidicoccus sp.]
MAYGYPSVLKDPRVQSSIRRIRAMGLAVDIREIDEDNVIIVIGVDSIVNYIIRKIDQSITWQKKSIKYLKDKNILRIYIWRGEGINELK